MKLTEHAHPILRSLRTVGISLGAFAAVGLGVPPLLRWESESQSAAQELRSERTRAEQQIARATAIRDSATMRGRQLIALGPLLLEGDSPSSAAATLAGLVSAAAAKSNVRIGSLQLTVDSAGAGVFLRVSVRGDLTGDVRGVSAMLAALERGPVLLSVRELSISQPDVSAPSDHVETLQSEFVVEGLMLDVRRASRK
jgi:Type II secretion system (T2SS), protein M subtype b